MRVFRRSKVQRHIRRFVLLLAVAPLLSCDLLTDPFDSWREKPEAVTVEASVDGLTITVTWTPAAHTYRYRVKLFEHPPGRGLVGEARVLAAVNVYQHQFTEADYGLRANNTYTVTVFSRNVNGTTRSTNSPTVRT